MKKSILTILFLTGAIAGLLITWQLKMEVPLTSNYPVDELEARDELFNSYLNEQSYLQSRIVYLRQQIEESQALIESQAEVSNLEILEKLKKKIGLTEIIGSGVEIRLDDSPFASREGAEVKDAQLVQASDIRDIVNLLNASNAEAISINNQRVIATSPITSVGTTILVNNAYIAPPISISAVVNSEAVLGRILNETLLPELYSRVKNANIVFEIVKKNTVSVPIYNGSLNTNYINLVE